MADEQAPAQSPAATTAAHDASAPGIISEKAVVLIGAQTIGGAPYLSGKALWLPAAHADELIASAAARPATATDIAVAGI